MDEHSIIQDESLLLPSGDCGEYYQRAAGTTTYVAECGDSAAR